MERIKIKPLASDFQLPVYATSGSAAIDLRAHFNSCIDGEKVLTRIYRQVGLAEYSNLDTDGFITIEPKQRAMIPLGFSIELPEGKALLISSRSGLSLKKGLMVVNSPGIVDSDYRGSVNVILYNSGLDPITICNGDRICQGMIIDVPQYNFELVEDLTDTDRGDGGFGHSGVK